MRTVIRLEPAPAVGIPEVLFVTRIRQSSEMPNQYDVSRDGQRFLINSTIEEGESLSVTLIVNWLEGLQQADSLSN